MSYGSNITPGKYYRLKVETATYRRKNNNDWENRQFTEYLYLKTGNPPGPASDLQSAMADSERYDLEPPLKDLSAYVAYTIPEGAAADEPLVICLSFLRHRCGI
jgi:hypothetical protein